MAPAVVAVVVVAPSRSHVAVAGVAALAAVPETDTSRRKRYLPDDVEPPGR